LKHKGFGKYNVLDEQGNEMFEEWFKSKQEAQEWIDARSTMQ